MFDSMAKIFRRCGYDHLRRGENMAALDCFIVVLDNEFDAESLCDVMIPLIRLGEAEEARSLLSEGLECRPDLRRAVLERVDSDLDLELLRPS